MLLDDTTVDSSTTDDDLLEDPDVSGDADDTGGDADDKGPVSYERFFEVNEKGKVTAAKLKEYEDFGDPAVLREERARLKLMESMLDQEPTDEPVAPKSEAEKTAKEQKDRAVVALKELGADPDVIAKTAGRQSEFEEALATRAWFETEDILIEQKLGSSADDVRGLAQLLTAEIKATPRLQAMYRTGAPDKAVRKAYTNLKTKLGKFSAGDDDRADKLATKKKAAKLSKAPTKAGVKSTDKAPSDGPKNLDEAEAAMLKRLEAMD